MFLLDPSRRYVLGDPVVKDLLDASSVDLTEHVLDKSLEVLAKCFVLLHLSILKAPVPLFAYFLSNLEQNIDERGVLVKFADSLVLEVLAEHESHHEVVVVDVVDAVLKYTVHFQE